MYSPYGNVSHVFLDSRLILQNVRFAVGETGRSLIIVESSGIEHECDVGDVARLEFYYHQTGPSMSPVYNAIIVLRFATELIYLCGPISPTNSFILTVNDVFKKFSNFQELVIRFTRLIKKDIVKPMPFTQLPQCVKDVIVQVATDYKRQMIRREGENEPKHNGESKKVNTILSDGCITLCSDDDEEEAPLSSEADYYDIDGRRVQITAAGIQSLKPGLYLNDEIINLALRQAVGKHPNVHLFDTLQSQKIFTVFENGQYDANATMDESIFKGYFYQYFFKGKGKDEVPRELKDTFFSKKMLMFPICHTRHWYLVVVVNPLLADVHDYLTPEERPESSAMAYFIDSLHGLKGHDMMGQRVSLTWKCIFSFIRLSAGYYAHSYLSPKLITCVYESNLPPQTNNSDCGCHLVHNAGLMAEMYDEMIKSPPTVCITDKQKEVLMEKVKAFRANFKTYLDGVRLQKGSPTISDLADDFRLDL